MGVLFDPHLITLPLLMHNTRDQFPTKPVEAEQHIHKDQEAKLYLQQKEEQKEQR